MTQGDTLYPTIFNIVVDEVVMADLLAVYGSREAQHGFGQASSEHNIFFYADDESIAGHNPIRVQTVLAAMVIIFDRAGVQTNLRNTKAMMFTPGFIWVQQVVEACNCRCTG